MAYLIHLMPAGTSRTYRVLSDLTDRAAAVEDARDALRADTGHRGPIACVGTEPANYTPLGDREYMPQHDLYTGHADDEDEPADVGNLVVGTRFGEVVVMTLPDGQTIKVFLHDVGRRGHIRLRVEAPKDVRIRSRKISEVEA